MVRGLDQLLRPTRGNTKQSNRHPILLNAVMSLLSAPQRPRQHSYADPPEEMKLSSGWEGAQGGGARAEVRSRGEAVFNLSPTWHGAQGAASRSECQAEEKA